MMGLSGTNPIVSQAASVLRKKYGQIWSPHSGKISLQKKWNKDFQIYKNKAEWNDQQQTFTTRYVKGSYSGIRKDTRWKSGSVQKKEEHQKWQICGKSTYFSILKISLKDNSIKQK